MHARRAILNAAKTALTASGGIDGIADRVHVGKARPTTIETACLLVYGRREQSDSITGNPPARRLSRTMILTIEALFPNADDDDAPADTFAQAIEEVLAAEPTLGGTCRDLILTSSDILATADTERRTGVLRLEFSVLYHTIATSPAVAV